MTHRQHDHRHRTPSSGTCSPASCEQGRRSPDWSVDGRPRPRAGRHHRRRPRPAGRAAGLRRRQRRSGSCDGEQFIDAIPHGIREAHGRQAHHPAGQARGRRARLRDHRRRGRGHQARRPARPARPRRASSASTPSATLRSTRRPGWPSAPASTPCATPASRWCMRYKTTTLGTQLPDRWGLPDALRDDTGVIFASAFPGFDVVRRRARGATTPTEGRREQLAGPRRRSGPRCGGDEPACAELDRRIAELRAPSSSRAVRVRPPLPVPRPVHGPLAVRRAHRRPRPEHAVNAACASTTQALVARRGLDPGRALPARGRGRRRRRHQRRPAAVGRRRLPGLRRRRHRRRRSRTRRSRSTAAATA